ncbi:hypothetical protein PHET_04271, partial [Paragonimus heterotremus]
IRPNLTHRSIVKDYFDLRKNIKTYTKNQVEIVENVHEELDVTRITISIVPSKGDYAHAKFIFRITIPEKYPDCAPAVRCETPIFHPNIAFRRKGDNVCLNLLTQWSKSYNLLTLVDGILFLLNNPNYRDPNNFDCAIPLGQTAKHCVERSLAGDTVNYVEYPRNQTWCEWRESMISTTYSTTHTQSEAVKNISKSPL